VRRRLIVTVVLLVWLAALAALGSATGSARSTEPVKLTVWLGSAAGSSTS
jgi:hypothetical protein